MPAHPLVATIRRELEAAADPDAARAMQAYMKTTQPYFGVKMTPRRGMVRAALAAHPITDEAAYRTVVQALWKGRTREEQYSAIDVAERVKRFRTPAMWDLYEGMLREAENWDTVDWISATLLGGLLKDTPRLSTKTTSWVRDQNMWVRRAALLVHLKHKKETDVARLSRAILALAHEKEFFIRKAIGWSLREYAKSDPAWVRRFVRDHAGRLSPLSLREATRNLG